MVMAGAALEQAAANAGTNSAQKKKAGMAGFRNRPAGSVLLSPVRRLEGERRRKLERETRLELATPTLARSCSTN